MNVFWGERVHVKNSNHVGNVFGILLEGSVSTQLGKIFYSDN